MMNLPASSYDVPHCVISFMSDRDISDADYHLYAAGRALTWVRIASDAIDAVEDWKAIEYHAYTGVSAARTTIDAFASWLNQRLGLGLKPSPAIDLAKPKFLERVRQNASTHAFPHLVALGNLAKEIDGHRQRAQHREGLSVVLYRDVPDGSHLEKYVAPQGLQFPRSDDVKIVELLRKWADRIELEICRLLSQIG